MRNETIHNPISAELNVCLQLSFATFVTEPSALSNGSVSVAPCPLGGLWLLYERHDEETGMCVRSNALCPVVTCVALPAVLLLLAQSATNHHQASGLFSRLQLQILQLVQRLR